MILTQAKLVTPNMTISKTGGDTRGVQKALAPQFKPVGSRLSYNTMASRDMRLT